MCICAKGSNYHSHQLITESQSSDVKCQYQLLEHPLRHNLVAFAQCHHDPSGRCLSAVPRPHWPRDAARPAKVHQQVTGNCTAKGISLSILHSRPAPLCRLLIIPPLRDELKGG